MQRGFSLLEMLLALVVLGSLVRIALPRFSSARDRLAVNAATTAIVHAHRTARMRAIVESRPLVLWVSPDSLVVRTVAGDSVRWRAPGPAAEGVALTSPSKAITFSPVGLSTGLSNASFALSRGSAARTVVVSRLGRVRVE